MGRHSAAWTAVNQSFADDAQRIKSLQEQIGKLEVAGENRKKLVELVLKLSDDDVAKILSGMESKNVCRICGAWDKEFPLGACFEWVCSNGCGDTPRRQLNNIEIPDPAREEGGDF